MDFLLSFFNVDCLRLTQTAKHLPAVQESQIPPLGREDPLEEGMATHSSILAWRISWTEELLAGYSPRQVFRSQRSWCLQLISSSLIKR